MSFILQEVLVGALGCDSDLDWSTDKKGISAIDLGLVPPGTGALFDKVRDLGKVFKKIEEIIDEETDNPYKQSIRDTIDSVLDSYRGTILQADTDIKNGILTTLTGLIAYLEPYQHELKIIDSFFQPILSLSPLEMLNKIHKTIIITPPPVDKKLMLVQYNVQQVLISQLEGYIYHHQKLPDIFDFKDGSVSFHNDINVSFIDKRLSDLLLIVVNVTSDCPDLFDNNDPPNITQLEKWINSVAKETSTLLSQRLKQCWPQYFHVLSTLILAERSDYVSQISRRMMNKHTTSYDISSIIKKFGYKVKILPSYSKTGLILKCNVSAPLNLIVTDAHQEILGQISHFMYSMSLCEEVLKDLWLVSRKNFQLYKISVMLQYLVRLLKDYCVFNIIMPTVGKLKKIGIDITDYLRFKAEFNQCISLAMAVFSTDLTEPLHNCTNSFKAIGKIIANDDEDSLFDSLHSNIKTVITSVQEIVDIFNRSGSEESIGLVRSANSVINYFTKYYQM